MLIIIFIRLVWLYRPVLHIFVNQAPIGKMCGWFNWRKKATDVCIRQYSKSMNTLLPRLNSYMLVDHVQAVNAAMQVSVHIKKQKSLRCTAIQNVNSNCFTLCVSPWRPSACRNRAFHGFCSEHKQLRLGAPMKTPHIKTHSLDLGQETYKNKFWMVKKGQDF